MDSDGDGITDGLEDANHNGLKDLGETDPRLVDSDNDGLEDGNEDANLNGLLDSNETSPSLADTDNDGLNDGLEINTPPILNVDTDADGLSDSAEDLNRNGLQMKVKQIRGMLTPTETPSTMVSNCEPKPIPCSMTRTAMVSRIKKRIAMEMVA